ncbi:AAA family ATPase [Myceligenerans indicum]|uniref:Nuclease SbcCD subunit C n=1 Tax=Myceligenerans indicum TaxID=2593663 RepID=A0ABS1LRL6_9MICO|nr:SMC family ATPase [Myceligenerans indicum]MBL0888880.1 SMC family ATPase [Myceligenerans indicum]
MQLHRLTFSALGPYRGTHTVDFARLTAAGLFLFEGPTGAGKSTLIDAMTFALYGQVAGQHASNDRLRSTHADPDAETYVELVFETASGIYRVRRSPAYERSKRRGTGMTKQPPSVKLWRLSSPDAGHHGEPLSLRPGEADEEIRRAIGLSRQQFVQTVVLPQGDFAAFLHAKPEDRTDLLQRVFGTEIYDQVETELSARRKTAEATIDERRELLRSEVDVLIGGLGDLADALSVTEAGDGSAPGATFRQVLTAAALAADPEAAGLAIQAENLRDVLDQELKTAADAEEAARAAADEAQVAYDIAREGARAVQHRDELRRELAVLDDASAKIVAAQDCLDAAQRAEGLRPLLAGLDDAHDARARAASELEVAVDALPLHVTARTVADLDSSWVR